MIHDTDISNKERAIVLDEIDNQYTFKPITGAQGLSGTIEAPKSKRDNQREARQNNDAQETKGLTSQQEAETRRNE